MEAFIQFSADVFWTTEALVFGGGGVALLALQYWAARMNWQANTKAWIKRVAIFVYVPFALFLAFFFAWQEKYDDVKALERRLSPVLLLEVNAAGRATIDDTGSQALLVIGSVINRGEKPSICENYEIVIISEDGTRYVKDYVPRRGKLDLKWGENTYNVSYENDLERKTTVDPVEFGPRKMGYLLVRIDEPNIIQSLSPSTEIEVRCTDILGQLIRGSKQISKGIPDLTQYPHFNFTPTDDL